MPATQSTLGDMIIFHVGDSTVVDKAAVVQTVSSADAYTVSTASGTFTRSAGLATSMLYTASGGRKTVLYRDADKSKTKGFSFSLFDHKDAASRALGMGGTAHLSLVLQNVLNSSESLVILQPPTQGNAIVQVGQFTPGETYEIKDTVTQETVGELTPEKDEANAGTIVVTTLPYNYKLTLSIDGYYAVDSDANITASSAEDFLLRGKSYSAKLLVANRGKPLTVSPAIGSGKGLSLVEVPAGLTISGIDQNRGLASIEGGSTFTYASSLSITANPADADFGNNDYLDYNPKLRLTDDAGNIWEETVPIRIWKDEFNVELLLPSSNKIIGSSIVECRAAAALITPEGRSIAIQGRFSGSLPRRSAGYLVCVNGSLLAPDIVVPYIVGAEVDGFSSPDSGKLDISPLNDVGLSDDSEEAAYLLPSGIYYSGSVAISGDPVDYLRIGVTTEPLPRSLVDAGTYASLPSGVARTSGSLVIQQVGATEMDKFSLTEGSTLLYTSPYRSKITGAITRPTSAGWASIFAVQSLDLVNYGYATDLIYATRSGSVYSFDAKSLAGTFLSSTTNGSTVSAPYGTSHAFMSYDWATTHTPSEFDFAMDSSGCVHLVASARASTTNNLAISYSRRGSGSWSSRKNLSPGGYVRPGWSPTIALDESTGTLRLLVAWAEGTRPIYALSEDGGASWDGGSLGSIESLPIRSRAFASFEGGVPYVYWGGRKTQIGAKAGN